MILVIICGHFLAPCFFLRRCANRFPPHSARNLSCSLFSPASSPRFFLLSSLSSCHFCLLRPRSRWMRKTIRVVTTSPCFLIKNNRRAFFLSVAREIISSDPFSRSIFVVSQSQWRKKKRERCFSISYLWRQCISFLNHKSTQVN